MGANPPKKSLYDQFSRSERLTLGRAGIGKKDITNDADVREARKIINQLGRMKNRLPNPASAEQARELREGFSGKPSKLFRVMNEPHVPAGDYADCGEFIAVAIKPTSTGSASTVQEISFPSSRLELVSHPKGNQLYIVGDGQELTDADLLVFSDSKSALVDLGQCRVISYAMKKYGLEVPPSARGADVRWDHEFGEEGGTRPTIYYNREMRRLVLGRATYRIQGSWIRD